MTATGVIDVPRASRPMPPGRQPAAALPPVRPAAAPRPAAARLHVEREQAPVWMRATGAVLLLVGTLSAGIVLGWPGSAPEVALVLPALLAMVVGPLVWSARTGVDVTPDAIVLRFRPLPSVTVRRDRIADVRLVDADVRTYGGIGLRVGRGWRAALLTPGPGIAVTDVRGRTWFVRTAHPEDALRALATDDPRHGQPRPGQPSPRTTPTRSGLIHGTGDSGQHRTGHPRIRRPMIEVRAPWHRCRHIAVDTPSPVSCRSSTSSRISRRERGVRQEPLT